MIPETVNRLRKLAKDTDTTMFMVLLSGYIALLYRFTGNEDITIGIPSANRSRAEVEGLIGFFVNMLAMRTSVTEELSFGELLELVRETVLGAFNHQDLPFEMLVEALQPERDTSRNPIFQVAFQHQNVNLSKLHLPGLTLDEVKTDYTAAKLDLMLAMSEDRNGSVNGVFRYNTDLFNQDTIVHMSDLFNRLVSDMVQEPNSIISQKTLLGDSERERLEHIWNQSVAEFPREKCVHELISEKAAEIPEAIALTLGNDVLTYGELEIKNQTNSLIVLFLMA